MSVIVPLGTVFVSVPTTAELDDLTGIVADLIAQHNALVAEVVTDEGRIKALEVAAVPTPPPLPLPPSPVGAVTDLHVAGSTASSLTLRFTEVDDGTGHPAQYSVRAAPAPLNFGITPNTLALPGTTIGQSRDFTISGLLPGAAYEVQLIAYRGTLNVDAVFGPLSNLAAGSTSTLPPPPPVLNTGLVFASDWSTALGIDPLTALRDGGRWDWAADWGGGKLMSVVAGLGPGGRNALRVMQRGGSFAAFVEKTNVVPVSTDYYVRYYMRNDDTSSSGDHVVVPDYQAYANLTYMRKYSATDGWTFDISLYGVTWIYPISHIGPVLKLARGVWYRFEYFIHFVDATHIQVHPRVYDAAGVLVFDDKDFRQQDLGTAVYNGRSDWSLASLYASGFSYAVNPVALTQFAMGNNGNGGATDTGQFWYFAGLEIRTDRWPGPLV